MKKLLQFDWLRSVQFLGNAVPKKETYGKFFDFKFLNFLTLMYIYSMRMFL